MADLLTTAWEGGSNYWVEVAEYLPPAGMTMDQLHAMAWEATPDDEKRFWKTSEGVPLYAILPYLPPSVGWKIVFRPVEEVEVGHLTPKSMREALHKLTKLNPHVAQRIMKGDYDALDADAWLQVGVFGKAIFG
jgi:hypothetical protein